MTPEGRVQSLLRKLVRQTGGKYRKLRWIGRRRAPDCFVWWPGVPAFIEVKRPGVDATEEQLREHVELRTSGIPVYVVDSELSVQLTVSLLSGMATTKQLT